MLPVALGRTGSRPPAQRGVEQHRARLDRGQRVGVAGVARVVEVAADRRAEPAPRRRRARGPATARRRRCAARTISAAPRRAPRGELEHARRVDGALERAAEGDGERHGSVRRRRARRASRAAASARRHSVMPWLRSQNVVGTREGVVDLVDAGGGRALVAALVEEARVAPCRAARRARRRPPRPPPSAGRAWGGRTDRLDAGHPAGRDGCKNSARTAGSSTAVLVLEPVARARRRRSRASPESSASEPRRAQKLHATGPEKP